MTESPTALSAEPAARAVPSWMSWAAVRPLVVRAVVLLGLGVAVGIAWSRFVPVVRGWSQNPEEEYLSGEVAMALLGTLAGLCVGVAVLVLPGRNPLGCTGVSLVGSVAGSMLAWGVGDLLDAPKIHATGVLLLWPLVAAAVTASVTLLQVLLRPDGP